MQSRVWPLVRYRGLASLALGLLLAACGSAGPADSGPVSGPVGGGVGTATLTWDAPTTRDDGSALTNLAGFRLYISYNGGPYLDPIDTGLGTAYTISALASGSYRFAVTAYDANGRESDLSLPATKTIH